MEKRYQVFISSTKKDLEDARQEVSHALLRAKCFPAQMENWPAVDEEQFDYIKKIIDQSDYFILISAGMYGSTHPETKLSYTEMEYDYAVAQGKPVIRLLHRDPFEKLTGARIEKTAKAKKALQKFRDKMTANRMVRFWDDPKELGNEVTLALLDMVESKPSIGWVRGDGRASDEAELEVFRLREELSKLGGETAAEQLNRRLQLNIPYFEACIKVESPGNYRVLVAELLEKLCSLFEDGIQDKQEIAEAFFEWEMSEEGSDILFDALIADEMIINSSPGSEYYTLSAFGLDVISRARLKKFLSR